MYPAANSLTYLHVSARLRCTPPRPGWPLHKRPAMTLVEVSQHAFLRFDYVRSIFVQYASIVLQCTLDVIFSSVILCWINPSWVLSPESWVLLGLSEFMCLHLVTHVYTYNKLLIFHDIFCCMDYQSTFNSFVELRHGIWDNKYITSAVHHL